MDREPRSLGVAVWLLLVDEYIRLLTRHSASAIIAGREKTRHATLAC
jgi:hypothetical protein